ncbi:MAG TPA: hypothetical protein VF227_02330 [Actinomycetes bacterium]
MGSGLIYAVIIVMWAAYFIPRWLRRHEELSESRSVERFDQAMRILSRKEPTPDKRYVVMPPRPEPRRSVPAQRSSRRRAAHSSATVRRRRVLAGLLLATLVTTLVTPLSPVPWWGALVALGATICYLVHLRMQARSNRFVSRTRQAVRKRSRSRIMRFDAVERLMAVRRELAEERAAEERRWQEAEEAERLVREAEEKRRREAEAGWSPVPVPLPTYVTKPVAPRRGPAIDLTNPGAWSQAQAQLSDDVPQPRPADVPDRPGGSGRGAMSGLLDDADEAGDQLDAIIERRAVND